MKKLLFILLAILLVGPVIIPTPAYAGPVKKQVIDITLDDDPTVYTSPAMRVANLSKVGFFIDVVESDGSAAASIKIYVQFSHDGTNWIDGYFYDFDIPESPLQTSQTISADGGYFFWLDEEWEIPQMRVWVQGFGTDATHTVAIDGYVVGTK